MIGERPLSFHTARLGPSMDPIEHAFACPYCGAPISMLLDPSVPSQTYVEDCEVCCHPIEVRYAVEDGEVVAFEARSLEQ